MAMMGSRRTRAVLAAAVVVLGVVAATLGSPPSVVAATATITARGPASVQKWGSESTTSLRLVPPAGVQPGDQLVAALGIGRSGASSQPAITPPAGWTSVRRTNQGGEGAIVVYTHRYASGETSYTFTSNVLVGGIGFVAAFGGVDATRPI